MKSPFLVGHRSYVRGLTREDLRGPMFDWTNDRVVTRYLYRGAFPSQIDQAERAYDATVASPGDVEFAIIDAATEAHIGIVGLHGINWIARSAEFRVLIGAREFWGRGYGTEATQLMCVYAFEVLNLHKVWLGVTAANVGGVVAYERAGFAREGVLRDETFRNGRYYDAVRMSILDDEYQRAKVTWPIADKIAEQFPAQP